MPNKKNPRRSENYSNQEIILPPFAEDPILRLNIRDSDQTPKPYCPPFWRKFTLAGTKTHPPGEAIIRAYVAQILKPEFGDEISRSIADLLTPAIIGKIRDLPRYKKRKRSK